MIVWLMLTGDIYDIYPSVKLTICLVLKENVGIKSCADFIWFVPVYPNIRLTKCLYDFLQSPEQNKELQRRICVHIVTVCAELFTHYVQKAQSKNSLSLIAQKPWNLQLLTYRHISASNCVSPIYIWSKDMVWHIKKI